MKLQHLYPVLAVCGLSLTLWACSGAKSTLTPRTSATPTINTDTFAIHPVDIKSEVLTISLQMVRKLLHWLQNMAIVKKQIMR